VCIEAMTNFCYNTSVFLWFRIREAFSSFGNDSLHRISPNRVVFEKISGKKTWKNRPNSDFFVNFFFRHFLKKWLIEILIGDGSRNFANGLLPTLFSLAKFRWQKSVGKIPRASVTDDRDDCPSAPKYATVRGIIPPLLCVCNHYHLVNAITFII
jgi:hypothetical protein